jgi:hypothetical protein
LGKQKAVLAEALAISGFPAAPRPGAHVADCVELFPVTSGYANGSDYLIVAANFWSPCSSTAPFQ